MVFNRIIFHSWRPVLFSIVFAMNRLLGHVLVNVGSSADIAISTSSIDYINLMVICVARKTKLGEYFHAATFYT
jgi:hypothetical protein